MLGQSVSSTSRRIGLAVVISAICVEGALWLVSDGENCGAVPLGCIESESRLSETQRSDRALPVVSALRTTDAAPRSAAARVPQVDDLVPLEAEDILTVSDQEDGADAVEGDPEAEAEAGDEAETDPAIDDPASGTAADDESNTLADPETTPTAASGTVSDTPQGSESSSSSFVSTEIGSGGSVTSRTVVAWKAGEQVETWLWPWPGVQDHGEVVPRASCDAYDAARISSASQLYLLGDSNYRVFCIAPGDYSAASALMIDGVSGSANLPRVVQLDSDLLDASLGVAEADDDELATLPPITLIDSDHWQFVGLRWQESTVAPLTLQSADAVLLDRVRVSLGVAGLSVTESDDFALQRSFVQGSAADETHCLAMSFGDGGSARVVNSEFADCHRALTVTVDAGGQLGAVNIAGNEFHRSAGAGDACDVVGLWLDGAASDAAPVLILDNQLSGWTPNSDCSSSLGAAVQLSSRAGAVDFDRNLVWDNAAGVVVDAGAGDMLMQDSVIVGDGSGHALRIGAGSDAISLLGNHFMQVDRWLDSDRDALTLSCNLISASGLPSSPVSANTVIAGSSYFDAMPGSLAAPDGSDQVHAFGAGGLGELCVASRALSDPETLCLSGAARDPSSVQCGSDYWLTQ